MLCLLVSLAAISLNESEGSFSSIVGWIGSWEVQGERDVGFWIGRDHWGNGYATAALRALLIRRADTSHRAEDG
jgi:RimJ/RimL family protein N-acetyltransferase